MPRVRILTPTPLPPLDYAVPSGMALSAGDFVRVPLGRREVLGIVWETGVENTPMPKGLRAVLARFDVPSMPEVQRRFIDRVAAYTISMPGMVLKMAMSVPQALEAPRARLLYCLRADAPEVRLTPARRKVLEGMAGQEPQSAADIAENAGCGENVIHGLADAGVLEAVPEAEAGPAAPDVSLARAELSPAQRQAADSLAAAVRAETYSTTVIDGVTGSGKTEVYFEAVAAALEMGKQVLILLPEIALSAQFLGRFRARFGVDPALWHSNLSAGARRRTWRDVAFGRARVVVGARSALFLPFAALGLIIADEEHDAAYKQEEGVIYNARDMAILRAHMGGIATLLVSATPSLETHANMEAGKYARVHLPERHAGARMPDIRLIDLRQDMPPRGHFLSPALREALQLTHAVGEQSLLFLNRRGYAPLTLCRACGYRLRCSQCSAWMVEHRQRGRMQCHHCGLSQTRPEACPACGATGQFSACGPGVERIAEEVAALMPSARMMVLASDTMTHPQALLDAIEKMAAREVDVVVGTQIMSKGHHFPMLTLVGVVDADLGLAGGDLRASERTWQLLQQVAGRAGRGDRPGRVLLQTHDPQNHVMQALLSGNRDDFVREELAERQAAFMPPYARLVALVVSAPSEGEAMEAGRLLARHAPRMQGVRVLGPAPAGMALLRGRHRLRLLMVCARGVDAQGLVRTWLAACPMPHGTKVQVDVDPYSFM
ncbi:MAG TPA: primosomal protein N' [Rhodospirillaceae bacterium]|nr:primosomal protein N' [Rhodospirillaceae bacterium]